MIRRWVGLSILEVQKKFRRLKGHSEMSTLVGAQWELRIYNYAHFRPHQALGGATPAEIYFGRGPAHLSAIPPPRGRPGKVLMESPFRVEYLDVGRMLPVLVRKVA